MLMLVDQPMHGYQLMQAISDSTGGVWRPSPGAVYPTIAHLQDEGLVTVEDVDGRRLVSLTTRGRADLAGRTARRGDPLAGFAQEQTEPALADALAAVVAAVEQLRSVGTPAQLAAADRVLAGTRRSLYLLLAGDEPTG